MVLPDIVLLKDYPQTREFLLDQLTLRAIDWWGQAFSSANVDVATIVGVKRPAPPRHRVHARVRDAQSPLAHKVPQQSFRDNPRFAFNLRLTPRKAAVLSQLGRGPALGDYFELHEGVHSGNMRKALFVDRSVDDSCREMYFGRDEITPYRLRWNGMWLVRSAAPRDRQQYANLGRASWFEREKLLVRRTGDHLLAAVDSAGRYASNNFFVVFPKRPGSLRLDGLCALLNSRLMTWWFRTIEPRQGRAFAELKIKHLRCCPLPQEIVDAEGCLAWNDLGARRREAAETLPPAGVGPGVGAAELDQQIDALALDTFNIPAPW